jgi:hypothetical protein
MNTKDLEELTHYMETEGLTYCLIQSDLYKQIPGFAFVKLRIDYLKAVNNIYKEIIKLSKEHNCNQEFVKRFEKE